MNEASLAYHRHCLERIEEINETFLGAREFVAEELFVEVQKDEPDSSPEFIRNRIMERRYKIQYDLDKLNMREGCDSQASKNAKEHYQEFSNFNKAEISEIINEKTE